MRASKNRYHSTAQRHAEPTPATHTEAPSLGAAALRESDGPGRLMRGVNLLRAAGLPAASPGMGSNRAMQALLASQATREGLDTRAASAAMASSSGFPLPDAVRIRMEGAFGHSFAHVRIHTDGAAQDAAIALNALAFTLGEAIYFGPGGFAPGDREGDELLAHELTHVVQGDEGRLAASGGGMDVTSPSDPVEQEARATASRIVGGDSAGLEPGDPALAPQSGSSDVQVHRWESMEHIELGDDLTEFHPFLPHDVRFFDPRTEQPDNILFGGIRLTIGEIIALSGDWFESPDQLLTCAMTEGTGKGTRGEIHYALDRIGTEATGEKADKLHEDHNRDPGKTLEDPSVGGVAETLALGGEKLWDDTAKAEVDARYKVLGADNASHFLDPGELESGGQAASARDGYRTYHTRALERAFDAGRYEGRPEFSALRDLHFCAAYLCEGFADHYLTDSFSAGHVSTPRESMSTHWKKAFPLFRENLIGWLTTKVVLGLGEVGDGIMNLVAEEVPAALDFGDVLSGLVHGRDNVSGIATTTGETLYGDGHLGEGDSTRLALAALQASSDELEAAYNAGQAAGDRPGGYVPPPAFVAEAMLPKVDPATAATDEAQWKVASIDELLAGAWFKTLIEQTGDELAHLVVDHSPPPRELTEKVKNYAKAKALLQAVGADMGKDPLGVIRAIADYIPSDRVADDSPLTYPVFTPRNQEIDIEWLKANAGKEGTLTRTQRRKLLDVLLDPGLLVIQTREADAAILTVLRTAPPKDARILHEEYEARLEDQFVFGGTVEDLLTYWALRREAMDGGGV